MHVHSTLQSIVCSADFKADRRCTKQRSRDQVTRDEMVGWHNVIEKPQRGEHYPCILIAIAQTAVAQPFRLPFLEILADANSEHGYRYECTVSPKARVASSVSPVFAITSGYLKQS